VTLTVAVGYASPFQKFADIPYPSSYRLVKFLPVGIAELTADALINLFKFPLCLCIVRRNNFLFFIFHGNYYSIANYCEFASPKARLTQSEALSKTCSCKTACTQFYHSFFKSKNNYTYFYTCFANLKVPPREHPFLQIYAHRLPACGYKNKACREQRHITHNRMGRHGKLIIDHCKYEWLEQFLEAVPSKVYAHTSIAGNVEEFGSRLMRRYVLKYDSRKNVNPNQQQA
jgi:hypothetical protein